jgi:dihydrofolate reductase
MTLDGCIEDPKDQDMNWVTKYFNHEMSEEMMEMAAHTDTLLLGRITYEILASYWPTDMARERDPFMFNHMNSSAKVVFSKTLDDPNWNNSNVLNEINVQQIQKMKDAPGKNMAIVGSASIARALMNFGLIDEYQLMLHPLAIGNGRPLFKNLKHRQKLELIRSKAYTNGVITLYYKSL